MTIATSDTSHVGELLLRRYRIGELAGGEHDDVVRHADACGQCRTRLRALDEEQRQFERDIPFERFAGGVERARRVPREVPRRLFYYFRQSSRRAKILWRVCEGRAQAGLARRSEVGRGPVRAAASRLPALWTAWSVVLAAAAAFVVVARTGPWRETVTGGEGGVHAPGSGHRAASRMKGAALEATMRVAAAGGRGQRAVAPGREEALAAGDRVRLGYRGERPRFAVALSIDERGEVTTLYADGGAGLRVGATQGTTFLPDSLEFTGRGLERVVLLLSGEPIGLGQARAAAAAAFRRAGGDLGKLTSLGMPAGGAEFAWLLRKP